MPEEKKSSATAKSAGTSRPSAPSGQVKPKIKKRKLSVLKRIRQEERKRKHNLSIKTKLKSLIKNVSLAIASKDKEKAREALRIASSALDKAALKNVIHRNKASRLKARLSRKVHALLSA